MIGGAAGQIAASLSGVERVISLDYLFTAPEEESATAAGIRYADLLKGDPVPEDGFEFERVAHDHPLWVLFSSGTTGLPKAIMHGHVGMLVSHYVVNALHLDLSDASRLFFYTTTGWMMFNTLVSALLVGSSIVTYDGSPMAPDPDVLWRLVAETGATVFGASPTYVQSMETSKVRPREAHDLSDLDMVLLSGSPSQPETFHWFYENVKTDLWVASTSGGTDICAAIAAPLATLPVRAGLMQCLALGIDAHAYDAAGRAVLGQVGELVISSPAPCMPIGFWGDEGDRRYRDTYFSEFPGVWRHGDLVCIDENGSVAIPGRSDATLNRHGVRIGTAEIYRSVERIPDVADSLVVAPQVAPGQSRMILFVQLREGGRLDEALEKTIRSRLRSECSPRHVPDEVVAVPSIPYTLSGKKMEVPVRRLLEGSEPARWRTEVR
jgi:acetoacetyl-CoA synthetase